MPIKLFTGFFALCFGWGSISAEPPAERAPSAARLDNVIAMRRQLGLLPEYENLTAVDNVKIAVLDYGFDGIDGVRPYLPPNASVVENYDPAFIRKFKLGDPDFHKSFAPGNSHGRSMAQIIWAVTGFRTDGPRFYLLNANGPTMLRRAVRYAIENKVDIILFSGTFEGGGNGDGRGPINRIAAEAIAAGIIWINAAGNFGGHVYAGPVDIRKDGYLHLGAGADQSALRFRNLLDENMVTITLTWNDYREEEDAGTTKDLDLYVEDWTGTQIGASEKVQVPRTKSLEGEESRNPRERVVLTDLAAAARNREYRVRIRARSGNFSSADGLRVLITSSRDTYVDPRTGATSDALEFPDATGKHEIYPPADNPLVLTVGDASPASARGPTADQRVKPDVILEDSRAVFSNGESTIGASNAAAYFAGVVALMKAAEPKLSTRHLLWFAHYGARPRPGSMSRVADEAAKNRPLRSRQASRTPAPPQDRRALPSAQRRGNNSLSSSNFADLRRSTSSVEAVPSARPAATTRRLWQTPTRQQLADEISSDR